MTLRPWRENTIPHEDVLKGTSQEAEFAADLSRVHEGTATPEYQDAALFYQRTFITEGMRLLLDVVAKRLSGLGGDPVIQLQTAFGGGKTHTMLAVWHLAKGDTSADKLQGIPAILEAAGIAEMPKAKIVVLDGNKLAPNTPKKRKGATVRCVWGELAWQLGGAAAYEQVRMADESGTSPGKEILATLLAEHAPCVILIDELVAYIRQFEEGKSYTGGTYDSNISFIQALTEALKAVPTACMLASLPQSTKEAGGQSGAKALEALKHYFGRVQALWKPVATEEAFEIVRRRLFASINDSAAADGVCRAYSDFYIENALEFPQETQESRYYERLRNAYPIHPELFDRLYEDWSSLDNFQRTRGVLKLMARIIHRLWKDGNNDLLIMPGSIPLYDPNVRKEPIYYLSQGWDPVMEHEIDGEKAETTAIESKDPRLGALTACRRISRTIFMGSAPDSVALGTKAAKGLDARHIMLGVIQPGQQTGLFKDALRRLDDLHYLNHANDRYWFDIRPNMRREMEERKRRYNDKEDIQPAIREKIISVASAGLFGGVHVFTPSNDIPDDWQLRLVVLPPDAGFSKKETHRWQSVAESILKQRGDQPRQKQNRLFFLAPDYDCVSRLKDQVRTMLAWKSIVDDYNEMKLTLDQFQAGQAKKSLDDSDNALRRMVREAYKWILAPVQDAKPGQGISDIRWEHFALNPGTASLSQEIENVLKDNELLISHWAPIHLHNILKTWFWKDGVNEVSALDVWQKTNCYLYLPRLKNDGVFQTAIATGAVSKDFFGLAYAKEDGEYKGFSFGEATTPILDASLLLIEPKAAAACAEVIKDKAAATTPSAGNYDPQLGVITLTGDSPSVVHDLASATPARKLMRRFFGSVDLDPILAKKQFTDIADEVILQFTSQPGAKVRIAIEIEAEDTAGFDETLQRAVKENCNSLGIKKSGFEDGM